MCFPGAIVLLSNSLPHNAAIVQQAIYRLVAYAA